MIVIARGRADITWLKVDHEPVFVKSGIGLYVCGGGGQVNSVTTAPGPSWYQPDSGRRKQGVRSFLWCFRNGLLFAAMIKYRLERCGIFYIELCESGDETRDLPSFTVRNDPAPRRSMFSDCIERSEFVSTNDQRFVCLCVCLKVTATHLRRLSWNSEWTYLV